MDEQDFADRFEFHDDMDILEIDLSGLTFTNSNEADMFHDLLDRRVLETGRTWYFLSCFERCAISPGAALQFSIRRDHAHDGSSRGAVRYGTSEEANSAMLSVKSDPKTVDNSFDSREEAIARINEMKATS